MKTGTFMNIQMQNGEFGLAMLVPSTKWYGIGYEAEGGGIIDYVYTPLNTIKHVFNGGILVNGWDLEGRIAAIEERLANGGL